MATQKSSNEGSGGKLLDVWHYEYEGVVQQGGVNEDGEPIKLHQVTVKKVAVELRLIKKFADSDKPPLVVKEVWFRVVCPELRWKIEGTDVELLRKEMFGRLDKHYEVKWEAYYLVTVSHHAPYYKGIGTGIEFIYERVEKGLAYDGTLLLRHRQWGGNERIVAWPGEFQDDQGKTIACIPATTQNTEALEEFAERVNALRRKLASLLTPDKIMKTLQTMSSNPLLPAPEPEKEEG